MNNVAPWLLDVSALAHHVKVMSVFIASSRGRPLQSILSNLQLCDLKVFLCNWSWFHLAGRSISQHAVSPL